MKGTVSKLIFKFLILSILQNFGPIFLLTSFSNILENVIST